MATRTHTLLERLLVASQRHSTTVLVAAAILAVIGGLMITRLSFDANVLRLLPREAPTVRAFERFLTDFGSLDHLYVTFESADPIGQHGDLVEAFVEALRQAPEIESVDSALFEAGKDWTYLYDRELYLLDPSEARRGAGAAASTCDRSGARPHARPAAGAFLGNQDDGAAGSAGTAHGARPPVRTSEGLRRVRPDADRICESGWTRASGDCQAAGRAVRY